MTDRALLVIVLATALALRLLALAAPVSAEAPDSPGYTAPAASLARGEGYLDGAGRPTAERPPGYPVVVAFAYALAGSQSTPAVQILQALLGTATVALVHALVRRRRDARTALVAATIVAVDPLALGTVPLLLREALLAFLVAGLLATLAAVPPGLRRGLAAGAWLAWLVLTHSLYAVLGPFLALGDAIGRDGARAVARRLVPWALAGALVAGSVGAWTARCWSIGERNLVLTSFPVIAAELWLSSECTNAWLPSDDATGFQARSFAEIARLQRERGTSGTKRELYARFFANLEAHPLLTLGRMGRINLWYWIEVPGAVRLVEGRLWPLRAFVLLPFHWAQLAAAAAGILVLRRERALGAFRVELATLAFFALAPAALYPIPRYLAPAGPVLDAFAAIALVALARRARPTTDRVEPATSSST